MSATERQAASLLFQQANRDRAAHHLPALRENSNLTLAAWRHAQRMAKARQLSHDLPGEADLTVRVQQAGVRCSTVAENIAEGPDPDRINDRWMHSPPHRANLLDPRLNAVGLGIVKGHGTFYVAQDFAREVSAMTPTQQEQQVAGLLTQLGLRTEAGSAVARSYCSNSGNQRPAPKLAMKYSTADLTVLPPQIKQRIEAGRFHSAKVGACRQSLQNGFAAYRTVILVY
ncbi:MAG: CAP domain-containing protein [Acidobacteriaceae bacterium]